MLHRAIWLMALVASMALAACSGDDRPEVDPRLFSPTAADLAERIGCSDVRRLPQGGPLDTGVADGGIRCSVGDASVEIYDRGSRAGGTLENIDRVFGTGVSSPQCPAWIAVGDDYIVVADDEQVVVGASAEVGGAARPVQPISPPFSFRAPGCELQT